MKALVKLNKKLSGLGRFGGFSIGVLDLNVTFQLFWPNFSVELFFSDPKKKKKIMAPFYGPNSRFCTYNIFLLHQSFIFFRPGEPFSIAKKKKFCLQKNIATLVKIFAMAYVVSIGLVGSSSEGIIYYICDNSFLWSWKVFTYKFFLTVEKSL